VYFMRRGIFLLGCLFLLSGGNPPGPAHAAEALESEELTGSPDVEFGAVPIPQHPRRTPAPELTLPQAAQPRREELRHYGTPLHRGQDLPIPGNASRNVVGPGEAAAAESELGDDPGLLRRWPHQVGGVTGEYVYTGGVFTKAHGGLTSESATRYIGTLDMVLNFDTAAMKLWEGGQFFLYFNNVHGSTLSPKYIGDYQLYDSLEATPRSDNFTQLNEGWYYHEWLDGALACKVGKQDAGANFAFNDLAGDFVNPSFTLIPTVPLPTYPNPGWGFSTFIKPHRNWMLSAGIYDAVFAGDSSALKHLGTGGSVSLAQIEYRPDWGWYASLPATYRFGAFYHTGDWEEVTVEPNPRTFAANHGFWTTIDQMLWTEGDKDSGQGLGAFFQAGWTSPDRVVVDRTFGAGLTYRGLLPGRDEDVLGVGYTGVYFSSQAEARDGTTYETATELFYRVRLTPHMVIQPDMQFIANPGGNGRDAFVIGSRFEIVL
jgi:porin